jgi:diguanylate cyclase (GGDEF)-like protein
MLLKLPISDKKQAHNNPIFPGKIQKKHKQFCIRIITGLGSATAILIVLALVSYQSLSKFMSISEQTRQTQEVLTKLEDVLSALKDAESGQKSYMITGNESNLESYRVAEEVVYTDIEYLNKLTANNPKQQEKVGTLALLIEKKLAFLKQTIDWRTNLEFHAASKAMLASKENNLMDEIRAKVDEIESEEKELLKQRNWEANASAWLAIFTNSSGIFLALFIFTKVYYLIDSQTFFRKQTETALRESEARLKTAMEWVSELETRNREIAQLREISELLQACLSIEEAYAVLVEIVPKLFPNVSGAVFVISTSKNLVEAVTTWGDETLGSEKIFTPSECWALRLGRTHWVEYSQRGLQCQHIHKHSSNVESLCVPMMAQGEALGVLHLSSQHQGLFTPAKQQLAVTVAEHIALALANLKLREAIQQQSIRDPLTGLFNRRYMEESLEREIHRASRASKCVAVIMLDVDHFKRFNDTFGHDAGDVVLRELGTFLQQQIRASDIACRYGGEELLLILPETTLEVATTRAEAIRSGVKELIVEHRRQSLGTITISLGVACFPEHGPSGAAVIRSADAALYRAKQQGRDRVECPSQK